MINGATYEEILEMNFDELLEVFGFCEKTENQK